MNDDKKQVVLEIEEILNGFDNRLDFKLRGDTAIGFNIINDEGEGYRYTYDLSTRENIENPLSGNSSNEVNLEVATTCIEHPKEYIFISNNRADIPLLHASGINYIIGHNDSILSDYTNEMNEASVILTVKSQQEIDVIHNMFDVGTPIVSVDFSELYEEYTKDDSLLDLSVKYQGFGENGIEGINKFLFSKAKKHTDTVSAEKSVETDTLVNDADVADDENLAVEGDVEIPLPSDEKISPKTTTYKKLLLTQLEDDKKYQLRVEEDQSTIRDLTQAYNDGETIPPIDVVQVSTERYIIVDGHHRYAAAKASGIESVECCFTKGSEHDAFILSLGANANNKALKRTNADKRNAVTTVLECKDFDNYSNREIADICKVSSTFVDKIVKERLSPTENHTATANVCTQEEFCTSKNDIDTSPSSNLERKVNTAPASTAPAKAKTFSESVKNEYISLSVTLKSKPREEESLQGLLTDLLNVINDYTTEFKEVT